MVFYCFVLFFSQGYGYPGYGKGYGLYNGKGYGLYNGKAGYGLYNGKGYGPFY